MKKMEGDQKIGNELGRLGEDIACNFLRKHKFKIVDRNYRKKCGEIDIVAQKDRKLYFVEVKSVSCEMSKDKVTHEILDGYRPEDNIHPQKVRRLRRVMQMYIADKNVSPETNWIFNIIIVKIDILSKKARVYFLKDIIL
jgi:putative endonuclease